MPSKLWSNRITKCNQPLRGKFNFKFSVLYGGNGRVRLFTAQPCYGRLASNQGFITNGSSLLFTPTSQFSPSSTKELLRKWVNWMLKSSPWKHAFKMKDADAVLEHGWFIDLNCDATYAMMASIHMRSLFYYTLPNTRPTLKNYLQHSLFMANGRIHFSTDAFPMLPFGELKERAAMKKGSTSFSVCKGYSKSEIRSGQSAFLNKVLSPVLEKLGVVGTVFYSKKEQRTIIANILKT